MNMSREQRIEGQRKSVEVRNTRRAELAKRREVVDTITDWSDREQLPIAALGTVLRLMEAVNNGLSDLPEITTALDVQRLAEAAKTVHSLMRLEMGESTSNVATSNVDKAELLARLGRIQESPDSSATST